MLIEINRLRLVALIRIFAAMSFSSRCMLAESSRALLTGLVPPSDVDGWTQRLCGRRPLQWLPAVDGEPGSDGPVATTSMPPLIFMFAYRDPFNQGATPPLVLSETVWGYCAFDDVARFLGKKASSICTSTYVKSGVPLKFHKHSYGDGGLYYGLRRRVITPENPPPASPPQPFGRCADAVIGAFKRCGAWDRPDIEAELVRLIERGTLPAKGIKMPAASPG